MKKHPKIIEKIVFEGKNTNSKAIRSDKFPMATIYDSSTEALIERFLGFLEDIYEHWDDNEILVVSEKELSTLNNVFKGLNLKNNNFCQILAKLPEKQPQKKYIFELYVLDVHQSESDVPKYFMFKISKVEEPFLIPVRMFKEVLNALRKIDKQMTNLSEAPINLTCITKFIGLFKKAQDWQYCAQPSIHHNTIKISKADLSYINEIFTELEFKKYNFCKTLKTIPQKYPEKSHILELYINDDHIDKKDDPKSFILKISPLPGSSLVMAHELKQILKGLQKIEDILKKSKKNAKRL